MFPDRARKRINRLTTLNQIGRALSAMANPKRVLEMALSESLRGTSFTCGYAALLDLGPAHGEQIVHG